MLARGSRERAQSWAGPCGGSWVCVIVSKRHVASWTRKVCIVTVCVQHLSLRSPEPGSEGSRTWVQCTVGWTLRGWAWGLEL